MRLLQRDGTGTKAVARGAARSMPGRLAIERAGTRYGSTVPLPSQWQQARLSSQMTLQSGNRIIKKPNEVGPVRWCITAFGGLVFTILVLMVAFSLLKWALHRFDRLVDPHSVIQEHPL